jgi:hypothetical protein
VTVIGHLFFTPRVIAGTVTAYVECHAVIPAKAEMTLREKRSDESKHFTDEKEGDRPENHESQ